MDRPTHGIGAGTTDFLGSAFRDVAHIGHIELLTPELDKSLWFFSEILAMREVAHRDGVSVYLRTWDDYERYTLKLTAHETSGIATVALRASSEDALQRRVAAIEASGRGIGWTDGDRGTGPTYRFTDPDGHPMAIYHETAWHVASEEAQPALKNQAERFPGRGVNARRLDHVNYLGADVEKNGRFVADVLGGRATEQIRLDNGRISAQWFHFTNKSYDLVYSEDWTGSTGRLHHVAFATDTREDILKAADIFLENGIHIESGPHKHAIQQTFFLYVYEPGGNRIEFCNAGARLILAPDWTTIEWTEAERRKGQAWGMKTIETFHTHGTPPVPAGPPADDTSGSAAEPPAGASGPADNTSGSAAVGPPAGASGPADNTSGSAAVGPPAGASGPADNTSGSAAVDGS